VLAQAASAANRNRFSLKRFRPFPEIALAGAVGLIVWALTMWR
jgi:hypothetical protein